MTDFNIVIRQQCKDLSKMHVQVGDYTVTRSHGYEFDHCSCKGYKFRHDCKHLDIALDSLCSWHQEFGIPIEKDGVCPECNGETEYVRFAV